MREKNISIFLSTFLFIICIGCSQRNSQNLDINKYEEKVNVIENPIITEDDYWGDDFFLNIKIETSGENISALIEKEEYSAADSSIDVSLASSKKGTGFYFYGVPAIERLDGDTWIRLGYKEADPSREQWCICAIEDAPDMNFSTRLSVDIDNISEELVAGKYRMVVFLSDKSLYVPFTVTGGNE